MTKLEKKSLELLNQRVQETNPQNLKEKYLPSTEKYQTTESPSNQQPKIYNFIGSFAQAPKFLQGNRFILHGYRINYDTPKKILNT